MIHSYNLKPFSYRTPKPYVDSNGEVKVAVTVQRDGIDYLNETIVP